MAGLMISSDESAELESWTLSIFDGDPANPHTKCPHEYYREVYPPQTAVACFAEAETVLRTYFGVGGWTKDVSPLAGFVRSWSRKVT
jgi:hypothetical protein